MHIHAPRCLCMGMEVGRGRSWGRDSGEQVETQPDLGDSFALVNTFAYSARTWVSLVAAARARVRSCLASVSVLATLEFK